MSGSPPRQRALSLADCVALGLNCIIGSGIYLLVAPMARAAGPASLVGIGVTALLCVLVAMCFAELAGMFDQNGGVFVYAEAAFGPAVSYLVGWMGLVSTVLSFSAVAAGFGAALGKVAPAFADPGARASASVALVAALAWVNYRGIKAGARTSDLLTLAKVVPLLAIAVVGAGWLKADVLGAALAAPEGRSYVGAVSSAAFLAVFMISGFEYVPVPAGEAKTQSAVPRAVLWSLGGATALYLVLQWVALSMLPDLGAREHPLLDVAELLFGGAGRQAVAVASLVSMAGFCAASMLVGPLYLEALAERGWLPAWLSGRSRHGTPGRAVLALAAVSAVLVVLQDYAALVDVANLAVFAQYLPVTLAVLVLRRKLPDRPRPFRIPAGPVVPVAAALVSVGLLAAAKPALKEWVTAGVLLAAGAGVWAATRALRRA